MNGQSKRMSLVEAITNTAVGYLLAYLVTGAMMGAMDVPITAPQLHLVTAVMTVLSVARGYVMRRLFNAFGALVLAIWFILPTGGAWAQMYPTPIAKKWELEKDKEGYLIAALLNDGEAHEAFMFACDPETRVLIAYANFSGFPRVPTPMQLAVQRSNGAVWRWGHPVIRSGGPRAGFPNYQLQGADAEQFLRAAATVGALISNGYTSMWNRTDAAANSRAIEQVKPCLSAAAKQ